MRIEDAIGITDMFSGRLRMEDGVNERFILKLATVIKEFEFEKDFPAIGNLYRRFERNPKDLVVADALARRLRKVFEFYLLEDNDPFIPHPAPGEVDGEIRIGECVSGGYFGRERLAYSQHEVISGRSGAGKTTIQLHTFESMQKIGVKCIVISSVKRSFRKLIRRFPNTLVIRCGAPDDTFKFNPLQLPEGANINQAKALFTRCLSESEQVYIGTENYIGTNLAKLYEKEDNPAFQELIERIKKDKPDYKEPRKAGYRDSALGRLVAISNTLGNMFNCKKGYPLLEILKHNNIIIEEDSLNTSEKQFINTLFIIWIFMSFLCQNFERTELRFLLIIEETHDVLNHRFTQISNPVILSFLQVVREMGMGVSLACQNPVCIDSRIFGNTATKIVMSLADGADIKKCADSMGFEEEEEKEIYKLQVGEAIVRTAWYPALFKIRTKPYDLNVSVSDSEIIENNTRILSNYNYVPLHSDAIEIKNEIPKIDMEEKIRKEESKNKTDEQEIKDTQISIADDEKKLLVDVYTRPFESVNFKCRSLGFSGSVGDRLKKSLIDKGLIAEYPIKLGHGRGKQGKILILLDKANSIIEPVQKIKYGRSANLYHSFIQQILKLHFENLWNLKVEIEMIKNGKSTDIGLVTNDGTFLAVEFENTLIHVRENISRNLGAGFSKVVTICDNQKLLKQINDVVEREFHSEKERITVCLLSDVLLGMIEI